VTRAPRKRRILTGAAQSPRTLALAMALLAAACGSPEPAPEAPRAAQDAAPKAAVEQAATAGPGSANHAVFAARAIGCAECHPCGKRDPNGHAVAWMDPASPGFHAFAANQDLASCQACHGANLDGVGGSTTISCARCHGASWRTSCTGCHGGTDSQTGAPPRTVWGRSSETLRVGTHTAHLAASHGLSAAVACATCHAVPSDALSAGHANGATADVALTGLAARGVAASWNRAAGTCTTYCHGATLAGGTQKTPLFTDTTGAARACGACHGAPPPAPHSTSTACGSCHTGYTATTVNPATHVNGTLDVVAMTCTSCHGSAANAAPPAGTRGETLTSTRAVGAHQKHLTGGSLGAAMACTECHAVPASTTHADGAVQLAWGPVARAGGASPVFSTANLSCSSTYCHGATLAAGGTNQAPVWTSGPGQASCGTCHGAPPPAPHSTSTACGSCHTGYTATTVNLATHVNGTLDVVAMTCTSCHGKAGQTATAAAPLNAAPPVDAAGASTGVRVGAHQKHLVGGAYANAMSCATCHATVATYTTGHANGVRNVGFTGAANANLQRGTWTAGAGTSAGSCASTWCHGAVITRANGPVGGTLTTPAWTGTVATCTSCHAVAMTSLSGKHNSESAHRRYACSTCHGTGYTATVTNNVATGTGVNKAAHVDGVRTIVTVASGTGIRTWNPTTRTCTASCHGSETW